jgi:hypothetical protein
LTGKNAAMRSREPSEHKIVQIELSVPENQRDELYAAWHEIVSGKRLRIQALERDVAAAATRARQALKTIEKAIRLQKDGGPAALLTAFLASLYNGYEFPFDLSDLRDLDIELANACLDYLNYHRLGLAEVQNELGGGEPELQRWIRHYGIRRPRAESDSAEDTRFAANTDALGEDADEAREH